MQLPTNLQTAIQEILPAYHLRPFLQARKTLTERYQNPASHAECMTTNIHRYAYLVTRFPATYGVIRKVLEYTSKISPQEIRTFLDLGAGPGTAMWAACAHFHSIERISLIEKDQELIQIGQNLARKSESSAIKQALWQMADLTLAHWDSHDLVMLSYVVGEIAQPKLLPIIQKAWEATDQLLIIIEPGTPAGFEKIRLIREYLIQHGAHLVAPCPHQKRCPMPPGDWCHFMARVERSSEHRRLKEGHLGYEDEKFSYVVASKHAVNLPFSRILRHPMKHSGHIIFQECTSQGLISRTISKKMKDLYRQARKAEWGDDFS
jgi:ribosomal protein RSM22 (predicted rRNA methylase)